jgi:hypothetical protein
MKNNIYMFISFFYLRFFKVKRAKSIAIVQPNARIVYNLFIRS